MRYCSGRVVATGLTLLATLLYAKPGKRVSKLGLGRRERKLRREKGDFEANGKDLVRREGKGGRLGEGDGVWFEICSLLDSV
jgi:hypothetical protein